MILYIKIICYLLNRYIEYGNSHFQYFLTWLKNHLARKLAQTHHRLKISPHPRFGNEIKKCQNHSTHYHMWLNSLLRPMLPSYPSCLSTHFSNPYDILSKRNLFVKENAQEFSDLQDCVFALLNVQVNCFWFMISLFFNPSKFFLDCGLLCLEKHVFTFIDSCRIIQDGIGNWLTPETGGF